MTGNRVQERRYATLDALSAALAFAYQVNVRPGERGRYYYAASLELSTLSDSDLDELERFLEGDLRGWHRARRESVRRWGAGRPGYCSASRDCRVCGWRRERPEFEVRGSVKGEG